MTIFVYLNDLLFQTSYWNNVNSIFRTAIGMFASCC